MVDRTRVSISSRRCKKKRTYQLRWICPTEKTLKSRTVGSDRKRAVTEAALLEEKLATGQYRHVVKTEWDQFIVDHCDAIPGIENAKMTRRVLEEFGKVTGVKGPHGVTYNMVERYAAHLRRRKLSVVTVNGKIGRLRRALRLAVRRGVAGVDPSDGWTREKEPEPEPRTLTVDEERTLVETAERLYGFQLKAFIVMGLQTAARRSELLGLEWRHIDLDSSTPSVLLTRTKGKRDRRVPLAEGTVSILRRLQIRTLTAGGPFRTLDRNRLFTRWTKIRRKAGLPWVTPHTLRRTAITRWVRAGVPIKTAQALAGHAMMSTTLRYYVSVTPDDMRAAILKVAAAG